MSALNGCMLGLIVVALSFANSYLGDIVDELRKLNAREDKK